MPQLIAMIIIVVGAMIYMFQTFGGTGDKIEGIAQKTSIITEINNIKNGLKLAARDGAILISTGTATTEASTTLQGLGFSAYFAEQINEQLKNGETTRKNARNVYNAISFGGDSGYTSDAENKATLQLTLVNTVTEKIPGIFVDLSKGGLKSNAAFLESQLATDLKAVAYIDRGATADTKYGVADLDTDEKKGISAGIAARIPGKTANPDLEDGMFTVYFYDFGGNELVK